MIENVYKELFYETSNNKRIIIRTTIDGAGYEFTNDGLYISSFRLTEALSENGLIFGSCIASEVEIDLLNVLGNVSLKDAWLNIYFQIGDNPEFPLGKYKVISDKPNADRKHRNIVAYDVLHDVITADVNEWYKSLSFPMSLKAFRNSFMEHFGVTQEDVTLVNDDLTVTKTISADSLSGKDVLECICEINGVFGHIDRNNTFRYITLKGIAESEQWTLESNQRISCDYEDYTVKPVTRIQIRTNQADIGGIYGFEGNDYVIENNFLVFGKTTPELQDIASKVYPNISNASYRPFNGKFLGNPCLEVGDAVVTQGKTAVIRSYVLARVMQGVQGLRDTLSSEGSEYYTEDVNGFHSSIIALQSKTNELTRTVEETQSTVTELSEATIGDTPNSLKSQITQNAENINMRVEQTTFNSMVDYLQKQIDSSFETYDVNYVPTFDNYPAYDWAESPLLDISLFDGNGEIPWIYTDKSYSQHAGTQVYNTEDGIPYRFTKDSNGNWYWKAIENTDYAIITQKVSDLTINLEGFKTEVSESYLKYDEASKTYETIESANSKIEQSAREIKTTVSQTYQTITQASTDLSTAKKYADGVGSSTLKEAQSVITQTATSIIQQVSATYETITASGTKYTQLSTNITQTADSIKAEAKRATEAEGALSGRIDLKPEKISLTVTNNDRTAGITIGWLENGKQKSVQEIINMSGLVAFTDLETSGATLINGSNIKTGTIDASLVTVKNINASYITSGIIDANIVAVQNLNASNIKTGTIDASIVTINNLSASKITTGTLQVGSLLVVNVSNSSVSIGGFTVSNNAIYNGTSSISSTRVGVYIGTDGIRNYYDANTYAMLKDGKLTCKGADITGSVTITGGSLEVKSGQSLFKADVTRGTVTIGGFTVSSNAIYKGTSSISSSYQGIYIGTDGILNYYNANAYAKIQNGVLTCVGANITGSVTITGGGLEVGNGLFKADVTKKVVTIGGFDVGSSSIYYGTNSIASSATGVYLGTNGIRCNFGSNKYFCLSANDMSCAGLNLTIKTESAVLFQTTSSSVSIGGFTVSGGSLYSNKSSISSTSNGVYLGKDGIAFGSGTYIDAYGNFVLRPYGWNSALSFGASGKGLTGYSCSIKFAGEERIGMNASSTYISGKYVRICSSSEDYLSFFGGTPQSKQTVRQDTTGTLASLKLKINELITALAKYNLIAM